MWESQGMRTHARQREAKCSSIRSTSTSPCSCAHPVQRGHGGVGEILVTVGLEPVERRARSARTVESRGTDEHDLVGRVENALSCRAEHPGRRCRGRPGCSGARPARRPHGRPSARACSHRGCRRPRSPPAGSRPGSCRRGRPRTCASAARSCRSVAIVSSVSRRRRYPSVPASGFASSATTRSPRCNANVCPTRRQVVVLPTPPLRETNATVRQPVIGVFTCATSSRRRSSAGLGPTETVPPVAT